MGEDRHSERLEPSLLRSTQALQATIDALSELQTLDQIVPRVLDIVADQFEATSCAFYSNAPSGEVRLRYWHVDGRTMLPDELIQLDPEKFALIRSLAQGFTVPDSYLGKPAAQVIYPVVLNHARGTSVPDFDRFAVDTGWDLELNIGVAAGGIRASTLCIYRGHQYPYSPEEIALADSLAKQLGLAMHTARLAEQVCEAAIIQEKAVAAERRAFELGRADALLRAVVKASRCLVENQDFPAGLTAASTALGEQTGVDRVYVFRRIESAANWVVESEWRLPGVKSYSEVVAAGLRDADFPDVAGKLLTGHAYHSVHQDRTGLNTAVNEECGSQSDLIVPILVNGAVWGCIGFDDCKTSREWLDAEIRVLEGAAAAISAAVSRTISEGNLREAVAREREAVAQRRAAELEKATGAMQASIDALATLSNLNEFVPAALRIAAAAFGSEQAQFYTQGVAEPIRLRYWLRDGAILTPPEILALKGEDAPVLRTLVEGFEAPDSHLGTAARKRQRASVVDHRRGSAAPEFDRYCCANRMEVELNVPLVIGEIAEGAMLFFRRPGETFSEGDIALAEALGKQIVLAMQAARLAEQTREAAISLEKATTAERRVQDLAGVNSVLTSSLARLSEASDMREFLAHVFAEIIRLTGATNACATRYDPKTNLLQLELFHDGSAPRWGMSGSELALWAAPYDADITAAFRIGLKHRQIFVASMTQDQIEIPIEAFALPGGLEWASSIGASDAAVSILFAGDQPVGTFHLHFTGGRTLRLEDLPVLNALSQQAAIALRLVVLSEQAQRAAIAAERGAAAEQRARAFARSSRALQATIEALGDTMDLDEIVPRVLTIAAEAFGSLCCSVFENQPSGRIRLLYWNLEGRTLTPFELFQLDPDKFGLVRRLAEGFESPESYLGIPSTAIGTRVLDHVQGTSVPDFDSFAVRAGWELELNVGVGIGGVRSSTLVIYRKRSSPFSPEEIALAESLATQLGLAMRFSRLAEDVKQSALAVEREHAAEARAAEMQRINDFISTTLGNLSESSDLGRTVESILKSFAHEIGAAHVFLFRHDAAHRSICLELSWIEDRIRRGPSGEEMPLFGAPFPEDITPAWQIMVDQRGLFTPDMAPLPPQEFGWPGALEYARRFELSDMGHIVLFAGDEAIGSIGFALRDGRKLSPADRFFIEGVAKQAALAIRMSDLAEQAKQVAIALEREKLVRDRAAQLAKANAALSKSVVQLTSETDRPLLDGILEVVREAMNAVSVAIQICDEDVLGAIANKNSRIEVYGAQQGLAEYLSELQPQFSSLVECSTLPLVEKNVFLKQGIRGQLTVPLHLGEELVGALMVRVREAAKPANEQVELAQSLAHQATLALRMTKLAANARTEAVAKAASEERASIARELHDTLLQSFTGITLQLRALSRRVPNEEGIAAAVGAIEHQATEAVQEARRSVSQMRGGEGLDLTAEVERFLNVELPPVEATVRFSEQGSRRILPNAIVGDLLRIVQEAVRNAVRHSGCSEIQVSLKYSHDGIRILVEDNGTGFELEPALRRPGHFGLNGMRERARLIPATLHICSASAHGTSVLVQYPAIEDTPPAQEGIA